MARQLGRLGVGRAGTGVRHARVERCDTAGAPATRPVGTHDTTSPWPRHGRDPATIRQARRAVWQGVDARHSAGARERGAATRPLGHATRPALAMTRPGQGPRHGHCARRLGVLAGSAGPSWCTVHLAQF